LSRPGFAISVQRYHYYFTLFNYNPGFCKNALFNTICQIESQPLKRIVPGNSTDDGRSTVGALTQP
jgi:hypothetical protein